MEKINSTSILQIYKKKDRDKSKSAPIIGKKRIILLLRLFQFCFQHLDHIDGHGSEVVGRFEAPLFACAVVVHTIGP